MHTYKLEYANGDTVIVPNITLKELIKQYNLATKENASTRIIQIS